VRLSSSGEFTGSVVSKRLKLPSVPIPDKLDGAVVRLSLEQPTKTMSVRMAPSMSDSFVFMLFLLWKIGLMVIIVFEK
jgi:hypothetical protein